MMKTVQLAAAGLEVQTGLPLYILVPLIIVIAIAAVIGVMWIYKRLNKGSRGQ